ncbi:PDR/VanB family oxidoreductase [Prauserella cavernicola]|uniref:Oxidoreductase n=1 Tax=Prauserella cavernicola TaxID=2800127 RepID=A0A934QMR2_9PSEU|nr:PDR/VanB family oxidoreductase [Prauserella cavernicola]MBK1783411.1 oxidoreductase [Prauserella cavernicola]
MTTAYRPSPALRLAGAASGAYRSVFAGSRLAPLLSRPKPVRRTGFELDLSIRDIRAEAEDVVSVTLADPHGRRLPAWVPGAHLDVVLPSGRQRQYSLCGDVTDRAVYRIAVRRIRDGHGGSAEVHDGLRVGDALRVRGPRNAFPLIDAASYLFIAGGIGITPILPMVRECHRRGRPWRLVYLGRTRASMPFLAELGEFGGAVDLRPDTETGPPRIAELLSLADPGAAVYLCGPPPLADGARGLLTEADPSASLHTERFSPLPVAGGEPFRLRLARSGLTVDVAADETALAAVRRALPGVAYSCRQGFCGTCRTRVLSGEVEHRDRTLTESEREDSVLLCVSRAASPTLTLDL